MYAIKGFDRSVDPPVHRELACNSAGHLLTAAGGSAPAPVLPPNAATASAQAAQTVELAAINTATTALAARVYNKADQAELQPAQVQAFAAGEFHRLRWSVQPTDRNNPDLNQAAKIDIGGTATRWYANQNGEINCTEINASAVFIDAGNARVTLVWEF